MFNHSNYFFKKQTKTIRQGLPGCTVVKNLPANAGENGFYPRSGKIPQAMEQLSPCITITEPVL